jgi:AP-2 complex subunit sigma-1
LSRFWVSATGSSQEVTRLTPSDAFFQNVCELDLVFSFYKVYAILDEVFLAGEIEETSKQVVLDRLDYLEKLE